MYCLCVSGLLGGGHERIITHLPAAPAGVWTGLSEAGMALGGELVMQSAPHGSVSALSL